jgi:hypothetical protein
MTGDRMPVLMSEDLLSPPPGDNRGDQYDANYCPAANQFACDLHTQMRGVLNLSGRASLL